LGTLGIAIRPDRSKSSTLRKDTERRMTAIQGIIWDYDGTLVDTRLKNYQVNRAIMEAITGKSADDFEALTSFERHEEANIRAANWRELYLSEYGLTEQQTDEAGRLWAPYQLKDKTPSPFFGGIPEVLEALDSFPQGIVSQNGKAIILEVLAQNGLAKYFDYVVGYEEVEYKRQKPAPDGLLLCLEELTGFEPGRVFYVGDHETDTRCVAQANAVLSQRGLSTEVISIGAFYGRQGNVSNWPVQPDHSVSSPAEIVSIVNSQI
jgi:HAD superfamily hydrolase (TIGR01549 family)